LGNYDFIFFDCAPSLDILNIAALVSSNWVIMPVEMSYLATVGLAQHIESLQELQDLGYDCQLKMVIPTFCDRVTKESREILRQLKETLGDLVASPIPRSVRFREAPAHYKTIWEYAPKSSGALAYRDSVERLLRGYRRAT
jgi:chromosome partitioning protein